MRSLFEVSLGLATLDGAWFGFRFKRETTDADADRNTEARVANIASDEGPCATSKGPFIKSTTMTQALPRRRSLDAGEESTVQAKRVARSRKCKSGG